MELNQNKEQENTTQTPKKKKLLSKLTLTIIYLSLLLVMLVVSVLLAAFLPNAWFFILGIGLAIWVLAVAFSILWMVIDANKLKHKI